MESSGVFSRRRQFLREAVALAGSIVAIGRVAPMDAIAQPTAAKPKVITPREARQNIGARVTVEFKVRHTKAAKAPDRVYLDSETDYRDPKNLGVLIEADALPAFEKARIKNPAEHYDGKTIRITGAVFLRDDNVFIKATVPGDIEVVQVKTGS